MCKVALVYEDRDKTTMTPSAITLCGKLASTVPSKSIGTVKPIPSLGNGWP